MRLQQVLQLEMERLSLSKGTDSDRAAKARLKGIDKQLKELKEDQQACSSQFALLCTKGFCRAAMPGIDQHPSIRSSQHNHVLRVP